jgi:hypothetical protein
MIPGQLLVNFIEMNCWSPSLVLVIAEEIEIIAFIVIEIEIPALTGPIVIMNGQVPFA